MISFSFIPAPAPNQTPAQRALQVYPGATIADDGNVALPTSDAADLIKAVERMNPRERAAVRAHGTGQELARIAITTMSVQGVTYQAGTGVKFDDDADLMRFFNRVLPVEDPADEAHKAATERPAELDEALEHLKRAGEALLPLVKREGKELFSELKSLFR